jgi:peptide-methionine (S)-S-oxide reductase
MFWPPRCSHFGKSTDEPAVAQTSMKRALFTLLLMTTAGLFAEMESKTARTETLVLGGGCFWCTEAAYELVPGVKSVVSGYAGGHVVNPTYKQVCNANTGHAEVVKIEYNPAEVSLSELLDLFWIVHDPTTLNRQGNDEGPQYRSIILYANDAQKAAAEKSKAAAQEKFSRPIVTEIVPLAEFYQAEDYHQDYFRNNPHQGYCQAVIRPKIDKFKKKLGSH